MKAIKITNKVLKYTIFITVFFMLAGLTYSYFVANLEGAETDTTITAESGKMDIIYNGGSYINVDGLAPSIEPFATKTFTVTGTSNIETSEMGYKVTLNIDENTLTNNAISYTLTSENTASNGDIIPTVTERIGLGTNDEVLGTGKFVGKVTNGIHTYELKLYFYETNEDQTIDMDKIFKAHIGIENYTPLPSAPNGWYTAPNGTLLYDLRTTNSVVSPLTAPGKAISTADEAVLASAEDDYGTSYYFRGAVQNNYIMFADMCWRIVRVNGDGSIKLVLYNYNKGANSCSQTGASYAFARYSGTTYTTAFNASYNQNAYVGFKYGTPGSGTYAAEHANTNKSTILTNLETWYTNNLASYANKLADSIWCNDKSTTAVGSYGTLGYGTNVTGYALKRLGYNGSGWDYATAAPTLKCSNDANGGSLSRFTVADSVNGNANLTYKIGLLTVDEAAYAGAMYSTSNSTYYLNQNATNNHWWSLSPYSFNGGNAHVCLVSSSGNLSYNYVSSSDGLRPAVSLNSTTQVTGSGTSSNPYVVID